MRPLRLTCSYKILNDITSLPGEGSMTCSKDSRNLWTATKSKETCYQADQTIVYRLSLEEHTTWCGTVVLQTKRSYFFLQVHSFRNRHYTRGVFNG